MWDSIVATPAASALALAALLFLAGCPLMKSRGGLLAMQFAAGLAFTSHYAILGAHAAASVCALGAIQAFCSLFASRSAKCNQVGWVLIPVMTAAGLWFWSGWSTAFCVAAMATISIARMQTNERLLRELLIVGAAVWFVHDVIVESWIAAAADVFAIGLGVQGLRRSGHAVVDAGLAWYMQWGWERLQRQEISVSTIRNGTP